MRPLVGTKLPGQHLRSYPDGCIEPADGQGHQGRHQGGLCHRRARKLNDGAGLLLVVRPTGSGWWRPGPTGAGRGLMQHIDLCVRRHLADGTLVRVLDASCPPFPGFYLYVPSRHQMPAKMRALIDLLSEKRAALGQAAGKRSRAASAGRRMGAKAPPRKASTRRTA